MTTFDALKAIVGAKYTVPGEELAERPQDFWNNDPTIALGLVRPGNVEEIAAILSQCDRDRQAVIVEGGRTNLVHGTRSNKDTILVSLDRLNTIEAPDTDNLSVEAQSGAVIESIQNECRRVDLRFGLDYGARGSAHLGGALSTNAGGFQALRYGVARDQVLGLECVLADGTVLSHLVSYPKDNTGYDLKQLFIGSEGTLGVITKAVLRLHPAPSTTNTALIAFDSFNAVARMLNRMRRDLRGTLSSFEIMWNEFFAFNTRAVFADSAPLGLEHPFYVICEAEGFDQDADASMFEACIAAALEAGDVADAVIAQSSQQRLELWKIREDFEAEIALFTNMVDFDVSLPVSRMEAFAEDATQVLKDKVPDNLGLHVIGHMGDGNLHVTTGVPRIDRTKTVKDVIYQIIAKHGGSISAEHGVGLAKRDYLHHSRSAAEVAVMRALKSTLDPNNILNPGKVLPI
ncbi:FAD-binding oxidoreductase [Tianweitania sp. BSSL-BM11]|uniref:FAD-binding oxidoreductase n=1 Tax=Tianweitania aestuarii TaxID=2814886 RepID=A0ABS5RVI3_9HYPH|nr:FAD-binding oxidoreductase [Tianweitania aestuarii]MBS9719712.1 FAD-binding oxidoreductase [Tianweitania aestuarii]